MADADLGDIGLDNAEGILSALQAFLKRSVPVLVDAEDDEFSSFIATPDTVSVLHQFIKQANQLPLHIHRVDGKTNAGTDGDGEDAAPGGGDPILKCSLKERFVAGAATVAVLKRFGAVALVETSKMQAQLLVTSLAAPGMDSAGQSSTLLGTMHQYVKQVYSPAFESYIYAQYRIEADDLNATGGLGQGEQGSGVGFSDVAKHLKQLSASLDTSSKNEGLEMANIELRVPPQVEVAKASTEGGAVPLTVAMLPKTVLEGKEPSQVFLQHLASQVKEWQDKIKAMLKKVDASAGSSKGGGERGGSGTTSSFPPTATQEVKLWKAFERVFLDIYRQLNEPERVFILKELKDRSYAKMAVPYIADYRSTLEPYLANRKEAVNGAEKSQGAAVKTEQYVVFMNLEFTSKLVSELKAIRESEDIRSLIDALGIIALDQKSKPDGGLFGRITDFLSRASNQAYIYACRVLVASAGDIFDQVCKILKSLDVMKGDRATVEALHIDLYGYRLSESEGGQQGGDTTGQTKPCLFSTNRARASLYGELSKFKVLGRNRVTQVVRTQAGSGAQGGTAGGSQEASSLDQQLKNAFGTLDKEGRFASLASLDKHLKDVFAFRAQYDDLAGIISDVAPDQYRVLSEQYDKFLQQCPGVGLDIEEEGIAAFHSARNSYDHQIETIDNRLASKVAEDLGQAQPKGSKEMLRVFNRYAAVIMRPAIRGAIDNYQRVLLEEAMKDVQKIDNKFRQNRYGSERRSGVAGSGAAFAVDQTRDVPEVVGKLLWGHQLRSHLAQALDRARRVLGDKVSEDPMAAKMSTNVHRISDDINKWIKDEFESWKKISMELEIKRVLQEPIFVVKKRTKSVAVNFDPAAIAIFKTVRNMDWLNAQGKAVSGALSVHFDTAGQVGDAGGGRQRDVSTVSLDVPKPLIDAADQAYHHYPWYTAVRDSLALYMQTTARVDSQHVAESGGGTVHKNGGIGFHTLLEDLKLRCQGKLLEGAGYTWVQLDRGAGGLKRQAKNSTPPYVKNLTQLVTEYQDRVEECEGTYDAIMHSLNRLGDCEHSESSFRDILNTIRGHCRELQVDYSNYSYWQGQLDDAVEEILKDRLSVALEMWIEQMRSTGGGGGGGEETSSDDEAASSPTTKKVAKTDAEIARDADLKLRREKVQLPRYDELNHRVVIDNNVITLVPPLEQSHSHWINHLHAFLSDICRLNRLSVDADTQSDSAKATFITLLEHLAPPSGSASAQDTDRGQTDSLLLAAYSAISTKVEDAREYIQHNWLQYQALWTLDSNSVYGNLGDDLMSWKRLLDQLNADKEGFTGRNSSQDKTVSFGLVRIDFREAVDDIEERYSSWQKKVKNTFAGKVSEDMTSTMDRLVDAKKGLEDLQLSNDEDSLISCIQKLISTIQSAYSDDNGWAKQVRGLKEGQALLQQQLYFKGKEGKAKLEKWLDVEQVSGAWNDLLSVLKVKQEAFGPEIGRLRETLERGAAALDSQWKEVKDDWELRKPEDGELSPPEALKILGEVETKLQGITSNADTSMDRLTTLRSACTAGGAGNTVFAKADEGSVTRKGGNGERVIVLKCTKVAGSNSYKGCVEYKGLPYDVLFIGQANSVIDGSVGDTTTPGSETGERADSSSTTEGIHSSGVRSVEVRVRGEVVLDSGLRLENPARNGLGLSEEDFLRFDLSVGNALLSVEAVKPQVDVLNQKLIQLKSVWSALEGINSELDDMKSQAWKEVDNKKLRSRLDREDNDDPTRRGLLQRIKGLPASMQLYPSCKRMTEEIKGYLSVNKVILDLTAECIKPRHWSAIQAKLNLRVAGTETEAQPAGRPASQDETTLGMIWASDLSNKAVQQKVKEILTQAAGEQALESFLGEEVKEKWNCYELDMVSYKNKGMLVRGWDDLFSLLDDHLSSFGSMKHSPFYREFEEEASAWERKLTSLYSIYNLWVDLQRRWVYLEGIFTSSGDIQQQLPDEYAKFMEVNREFLGLSRKVHREGGSKALCVLGYDGLTTVGKRIGTLDRLVDILTKIQKSLGDYLEKQRAAFARFYFVGDEDLLEIIGNAKDPGKIQKHIKKMFAGIAALDLPGDASDVDAPPALEILGMISVEYERVSFASPLSMVKASGGKEPLKVHEWLKGVELGMQGCLSTALTTAFNSMASFWPSDGAVRGGVESFDGDAMLTWLNSTPGQIVVLSAQMFWTRTMEEVLKSGGDKAKERLDGPLASISSGFKVLADRVLEDMTVLLRQKCEHLVTELVHQRDVVRSLKTEEGLKDKTDFAWLYHMRFYMDQSQAAPATARPVTGRGGGGGNPYLKQVRVEMANSIQHYSFEYIGVCERLVQTPLTDKCYLTLMQALSARMGGSPFGPAGTGKTETVKMLGNQLGRFTLVFNCDETFDYQAMCRIFVGLCQCGAWGCFDEFNRLEERVLSAISQQIQTIQVGLRNRAPSIELTNRSISLSGNTGMFITMNPGYAGRSNLPDNLKQLFRSIAMVNPDRELIAQCMLYSQGFRSAEALSSKVVPLFVLCKEQLSEQSHYDFGLRALKAVLRCAGRLKREAMEKRNQELADGIISDTPETPRDLEESEKTVLLRSVCETLVPKLVSEDMPLLESLISGIFPGCTVVPIEADTLRSHIQTLCEERKLVPGEGWMEKVLQLYSIQTIHHGVMLVGPPGTGKTEAWRILLKALERADGVKGEMYVIDPKALTKEELYGSLDPTTRDWTDGVLTSIFRKVLDTTRGIDDKRHWIVFDGDVDPEWVENLNSVLDDNRLLTLPNGERLELRPNVRIMFEVQDLRTATLATVSRCGMIWFSDDIVSPHMMLTHYLMQLRAGEVLPAGTLVESLDPDISQAAEYSGTSGLLHQIQYFAADVFGELMDGDDSVVCRALEEGAAIGDGMHVMDVSVPMLLCSVKCLLDKGIMNIITYNNDHVDFPLSKAVSHTYLTRHLITSLLWGCTGSATLKARTGFADFLAQQSAVPMPSGMTGGLTLIDYYVSMSEGPNPGEWAKWRDRVPQVELEPGKVVAHDVVISTVDTMRHVSVVHAWLSARKPLLLCGPPGSGKSMTLTDTLKLATDIDFVALNFSSATSPDLILKTFDQFCEYTKTPQGIVVAPTSTKWLVVFCDEINLPQPDKYGTQKVITFIRQLIEHNGFWRASDLSFVRMERIQIVGACNPPTDAGRTPMPPRLLRHMPLLLVDFPGRESLVHIYGTFMRALLKTQKDSMRDCAGALTEAMVDVFYAAQAHFTPDQQAHYIYSPRELSRWVRALYEVLKHQEIPSREMLVRLWLHEGLRLFSDRLVEDAEREWMDDCLDNTARKHFKQIDMTVTLERPVLFSDWLTQNTENVGVEPLREVVKQKLKVFYEEELDVQLVVFDEVLFHALRIDRVLKQPFGHALLIGVSGGGKTTLARFVAWMNGLSIFTIKVSKQYTMTNFLEDLRMVMKRAGGSANEKICFIFDESNVLDTSFLEVMNALLASGEVPGLFEGDEFARLMDEIREGPMDTEDDLYRKFTKKVQVNLHVVFTMNPATSDFSNRAATSPALFNRCVLDWFGEWSSSALFQVGCNLTQCIAADVEEAAGTGASAGGGPGDESEYSASEFRQCLVNCMVFMHNTVTIKANSLKKRSMVTTYITPRHYLDFITQFVNVFREKRDGLIEQKLHLTGGLDKLLETEKLVIDMQEKLAVKDEELKKQDELAKITLEQMVAEKTKGEQDKDVAEKFAVQVAEQTVQVNKRKAVVEEELSGVSVLIAQAQEAVKGVTKKDLDEIRSFANPPPNVQMTLEAMIMLQESTDHEVAAKHSWNEMKSLIRKPEFIQNILNFDTETMLGELVKEALENQYTKTPNWDVSKIARSSSACGPLAKWLESQLQYADILQRSGPMRAEIKDLEYQVKQKTLDQQNALNRVNELEESIGKLQSDYGLLVSRSEDIKKEKITIGEKVQRSKDLLDKLGAERYRWEDQVSSFDEAMSTVVGDSLLGSGFLAYLGFFDNNTRHGPGGASGFMGRWSDRLSQGDGTGLQVIAKPCLNLVNFLSTPDQQLTWKSHGLQGDELSCENAIMLDPVRHNRYPLVIDPSGQATAYLLSLHADSRIEHTSFLDKSFIKMLESCLRFGRPLLVEDVESIDPILNPVLNKEVRREGGRTLIRVGDNEVDFSPTFEIFMCTRDPTAQFAADLCSRVTFVNFSVTHSSLREQCLNLVIKAERPDIDKKQTDLLKVQGECQVKMLNLEKQLLDLLREAEGSILENNDLIDTLEILKHEASEVSTALEQAEEVNMEISDVRAKYEKFAGGASEIYFTLEELPQIHFLYHFSLTYYLAILDSILSPVTNSELAALSTEKDADSRLEVLERCLFRDSFHRVARGLLFKDHLTLALRFVEIALSPSGLISKDDFQALMKSNSRGDDDDDEDGGRDDLVTPRLTAAQSLPWLTKSQSLGLTDLRYAGSPSTSLSDGTITPVSALLAPLAMVPQHIEDHKDEWKTFAESLTAECCVPSLGQQSGQSNNRKSVISESFRGLMILKAVRPDRLMAGVARLVEAVFPVHTSTSGICSGEGPSLYPLPPLDLSYLVERCGPGTPLLLCSQPGFDASGKVDALAAGSGGMPYTSVALGSAEGFTLADKAVDSAARSGSWVLLKNVHLAPAWLAVLEKRLNVLKPNARFRLFMTMEMTPSVPSTLIRQSNVVVYESPPGVLASVKNSMSLFSAERVQKAPAQRSRLYLILAWFHAVVLERLRYTPTGWTKKYEFSETDLTFAADQIDAWVDMNADRIVSESDIPWKALRSILKQSVYGSRIDNVVDLRLMAALVDRMFTPDCYRDDFRLVNINGMDTAEPVYIAEAGKSSKGEFEEWLSGLSSLNENPQWLGLPETADGLLKAKEAHDALNGLLSMTSVHSEDDDSAAPPVEKSGSVSSRQGGGGDALPGWMRSLQGSVDRWSNQMDKVKQTMDGIHLSRTAETITNPLFRFLEREVLTGTTLLATIQSDFISMSEVFEGRVKADRAVKAVMEGLTKGTVPKSWSSAYPLPYPTMHPSEWLTDFAVRLGQLRNMSACPASGGARERYSTLGLGGKGLWLGGLFCPEAFFTATQQAAAQAQGISLEELTLTVNQLGEGGQTAAVDASCFCAEGIVVEAGAGFKDGHLTANESGDGCVTQEEQSASSLPCMVFRWVLRDSEEGVDSLVGTGRVLVPLYLNNTRKELLLQLNMKAPEGRAEGESRYLFLGTSLTAWDVLSRNALTGK